MSRLLGKVEGADKAKGGRISTLREWQKYLLNEPYFMRYLRLLVLRIPKRYVT
jgi:hypothetical protein